MPADRREIGAEIEQCSAFGGRRCECENRNARFFRRRYHCVGRHQNGDIAANPERLSAARDQRIGRFSDARRVLDRRFEQLDAEHFANLSRLHGECARIGFGGIPRDADRFQSGEHSPRQFEVGRHRHERADAREMSWMIHRGFPADSDACTERIGHSPENVYGLSRFIRIGDGLRRQRTGCENQLEFAVGDFFGDGVVRGEIILGIEASEDDVLAIAVAGIRQSIEHALDRFIQQLHGRMLQDRHARHSSRIRLALIPIRQQEDTRSQCNENKSARKTLQR